MFHVEHGSRTYRARYDPRPMWERARTPILIALAALAAHALALSAGWIWDDDDYITANALLQSPDGWMTLWVPGATPQYYPLVFLGFWIEHAVFGLDPLVYHANNLLLHTASAILLWRILAELRVPHAAWIAALFAVHPMGVESVAWATERKNTQSLAFALASVLTFIHATRAGEGRVLGAHIAAFLLFVCALLSKTTAIFVPPVLVMIALHERRRVDARFAMLVAPYFVTGAALGLFTAVVEKVQVGATGAEFSMSAIERVLLAARSIVFYATRFAVPREQVFVYPRRVVDAGSVVDWIPLLCMLAVLTGAVIAWRTRRAPMLLLLWVCAALFPALGFFDVWPFRFSFVADHFAYAAMPALATVLVLTLGAVAARVQRPRVLDVTLPLLLAVCMPLSWIASAKYAGVEALWRDTIARNPDAWLAHNNLATELLAQAGRAVASGTQTAEGQARVRELAEEALVHATRACELKPDELTHPSNQSEALRLLGRREEALESILRAEALAPHMPEFRWMRGRLLEELGRLDEAREAYLSAADDPRDRRHALDAVRGMLSIAVKRKDYADAIAQGRRLVQLVPGDADAVANLGALLVASGDASGGRAEYLRALTGDAGFSSERAFMTTAIRYLRAAIATTLDEREAQLARALAEQLASDAPGDPMLRFIQLALAVTRGDRDAKGAIERMEREARAANAVEFADELAAFLRAH